MPTQGSVRIQSYRSSLIELQNTRENPYIPFTNPGTHLKIPKEPDSYLTKSPYLRKKTKNTWENPCIPWNAFCQWANYLALCAVRLAASAAYMNMKMNIESSGATCPRLPATFRCFILFLQSLRMLMYQSYFSYTYTLVKRVFSIVGHQNAH